MLPTLSRLSVRTGPAGRLRHGYSCRSLRIPPLHLEFHSPLPCSSQAVPHAVPELSPGISRVTYPAAYAPFTPSDSGQRSHPPYYRGCWHGVSRCFLWRYRHPRAPIRSRVFVPPDSGLQPEGRHPSEVLFQRISSLTKAVYNPKAFFPHAAWLDQTFVHCPKVPTAASRRSLGRVSVPMWLAILSDQLPVVALVSRYLTN